MNFMFQELEQINTTADEMEIYALVNRKFKQIFLRQETMKTFKTYDRLEVGLDENSLVSFYVTFAEYNVIASKFLLILNSNKYEKYRKILKIFSHSALLIFSLGKRNGDLSLLSKR